MVNVVVKEQNLISAANEGMDAFIEVFVDAIKNAIGGELTATIECFANNSLSLSHFKRRGYGRRIYTTYS